MMNTRNHFRTLAVVATFGAVLPMSALLSTSALAQDLKVSKTKEGTISYPSEWGAISIKKVADSPLLSPTDVPDGVGPAHIECSFSKSKSTIAIYPVKDADTASFKKKYGVVSKAVDDLRKLLKLHPAAPKEIPYLPWEDAGGPINAQVKYTNGKDRTSVRFLTQHTSEPAEINNTDLFYSSQSLTTDGKSYIATNFIVTAEGLPAKDGAGQMKADKYKQFSKEYATYSKTMEKKLDALGDTAFKPSLVTLDKVSESISLQ